MPIPETTKLPAVMKRLMDLKETVRLEFRFYSSEPVERVELTIGKCDLEAID